MSSDSDDIHVARPCSFYGVYILCNKNPMYMGSTYIGFTVNPARRIRQHNREIKGGAWKTGRGPWDMVLITHGFNTKLAALQFEWAWQNPHRSRRLKHLCLKQTCRRKKDGFVYGLRVLSEMLNTGPWNRLPLTIQWLKQEYIHDFPVHKPLPTHMPIAYGAIRTVKDKNPPKKKNIDSASEQIVAESDTCATDKECCECQVCNQTDQHDVLNPLLHCIVDTCNFLAHMRCYSNTFLQQNSEVGKFLTPMWGACPGCKEEMSWSDVIKQKRYTLNIVENDDEDDDGDEDSDICDDENIGGTQKISFGDDEEDDFQ